MGRCAWLQLLRFLDCSNHVAHVAKEGIILGFFYGSYAYKTSISLISQAVGLDVAGWGNYFQPLSPLCNI